MTTQQSPYIIAIAGGSGSGKTTVSNHLVEAFPPGYVTVVGFDWYYRDHPELTPEERKILNYDHPDAFDSELLITHLHRLRSGQSVNAPQYDFTINRVSQEVVTIPATPVIIVEGILTLHFPHLRSLFDLSIFIDTPDDVRLIRRLDRDQRERGRTEDSVRQKWASSALPMHKQYCEPSRAYAVLVINGSAEVDDCVGEVYRRVCEQNGNLFTRQAQTPRS